MSRSRSLARRNEREAGAGSIRDDELTTMELERFVEQRGEPVDVFDRGAIGQRSREAQAVFGEEMARHRDVVGRRERRRPSEFTEAADAL